MSRVPPRYKFRCPLCLTKLREPEKLVLYKPASAESETERPDKSITCTENFMQEVQDFVGDRANNLRGGIFVSHVGCAAKNPFISSDGKVKISDDPGAGDRCNVEVICVFTKKPMIVNVKHWIVGMLRETLNYSKEYDSMWFPYLLLAATASTDGGETKRPCGNLVELAGTRDVGKTIMTVQLMHEHLFSEGLRSFEFFFRGQASDAYSFFEELVTFSAWKDLPSFRPVGTHRTWGDLRAVFVQRISKETANVSLNDGQTKKRPSLSQWLLKLLREDIPRVGGAPAAQETTASNFTLRPSQRWVPVLFYDSAGESNEDFSQMTERLRRVTNRLAICIDSEELIDPAREKDSIKHAGERLRLRQMEQENRKVPTCIVVTKADLLASRLPETESKLVAESIQVGSKAKAAARKLLTTLLKNDGTSDAKALLEDLSTKDLVDEVFFVGTTNLPFMHGIRYSPIATFEPNQAKKGETVTIKANRNYYEFKVNGAIEPQDGTGSGLSALNVKSIRFNGEEAKITIKDNETIEAIVPEDNSRGFIEIVSEYLAGAPAVLTRDEANSSALFNVVKVADKEVLKPKSFGLTRFLAWCGGVNESVIVREPTASGQND